MAVSAAETVVGTTAVQLGGVDTSGVYGQRLVVRNTGTSTVYLGGPAVTTTTGLPLDASASLTLTLEADDQVYAVATVAGTVRVLRVGG